MAQVLISGGSGLVGKFLCEKLLTMGYEVAILSRSKNAGEKYKTFLWDPQNRQIDSKAIASSDYIIHLAGANIAEKRWTASRKKLIIDSRVESANLILNEVKIQNKKLKAFISASAVGYYGAISSEDIFTEENDAANDFLGQTCLKWEEAAKQFIDLDIRTVVLRTGLVLSKKGGVLFKMLIPAKLGLASTLGDGKHYLPWIHIEDLCDIYIKAIEDKHMIGVYNAVAPDVQTNLSFTKTLARVLNRPFFFPKIPAFILKFILGELSVAILNGSRISSEKLISKGYNYKFTGLNDALIKLLK